MSGVGVDQAMNRTWTMSQLCYGFRHASYTWPAGALVIER